MFKYPVSGMMVVQKFRKKSLLGQMDNHIKIIKDPLYMGFFHSSCPVSYYYDETDFVFQGRIYVANYGQKFMDVVRLPASSCITPVRLPLGSVTFPIIFTLWSSLPPFPLILPWR